MRSEVASERQRMAMTERAKLRVEQVAATKAPRETIVLCRGTNLDLTILNAKPKRLHQQLPNAVQLGNQHRSDMHPRPIATFPQTSQARAGDLQPISHYPRQRGDNGGRLNTAVKVEFKDPRVAVVGMAEPYRVNEVVWSGVTPALRFSRDSCCNMSSNRPANVAPMLDRYPS
jgi:hypothetical protein